MPPHPKKNPKVAYCWSNCLLVPDTDSDDRRGVGRAFLYIDRFFGLVTESGLKKINTNQTLGVFFMTDITGLVMVPPSFFKILKPVEPD